MIPVSIAESPLKDAILAVWQSALAAVEPRRAVAKHVKLRGDKLVVNDAVYDLSSIGRIQILGAGKAAQPMAEGLVQVLKERIDGGLVVVKQGGIDHSTDTGRVKIVEAGHPVPDDAGVKAASKIVDLAAELDEHDLALVVIAGGASALLTLPAKGLRLEDLQITTDLLLKSGATIQELNTVRKHLSLIKGGQLARHIFPARTIGLVLSDVIGDPLDAIGSGLTAPDPTTYAEALSVLKHYGLDDKVNRAVREHIESGVKGESDDTPTRLQSLFGLVQNTIVASNRHAAEAAVRTAREHGLNALLLTTALSGEAKEIGRSTAALARDLVLNNRPIPRPACLVLGGETTVTVRGNGRGGRNQELALSTAIALEGLDNVLVVALATDGEDGPTDAAGAVAKGNTLLRARALNLIPHRHLENNDAYPFFEALDDLIQTGPTHTNVADLVFVFAF